MDILAFIFMLFGGGTIAAIGLAALRRSRYKPTYPADRTAQVKQAINAELQRRLKA
jgi:hypothetical protein